MSMRAHSSEKRAWGQRDWRKRWARTVRRRSDREAAFEDRKPPHACAHGVVSWCRGRRGREHVLPEVELEDFGHDRIQRVDVPCERCGLWVELTRPGERFSETPRKIVLSDSAEHLADRLHQSNLHVRRPA